MHIIKVGEVHLGGLFRVEWLPKSSLKWTSWRTGKIWIGGENVPARDQSHRGGATVFWRDWLDWNAKSGGLGTERSVF